MICLCVRTHQEKRGHCTRLISLSFVLLESLENEHIFPRVLEKYKKRRKLSVRLSVMMMLFGTSLRCLPWIVCLAAF
jgi:hypothetical protein